ncbi:hypothetical protein OAM23_01790 [Luminiphilus sp.]|nr:hypothetical protein [Luminiphilus sp.]
MTILLGLAHFTLETLFTLRFGQTLAGYLPDLIAAALLITGGYQAMKDRKAVGILCGAWGFTCCLHYRSWAWRFDEMMAGSSTELVNTTLYVLAATMPISFAAFGIALYLCWPKNRRHPNE